MKRILILTFLILMVFGLTAKSFYVEKLNVEAEFRSDGKLVVEENWTYTFDGGPFTKIYRHISDEYCDGVDPIEIRNDGHLLNPDNKDECKIERDDGMVMYVFLPKYSDRSTTVTWKYVITNPYEVHDDILYFNWMPVPYSYEFLIKEGQIRLKKPQSIKVTPRPYPIKLVSMQESDEFYIYNFENLNNQSFIIGYKGDADDFRLNQPKYVQTRKNQEKYSLLNGITGLSALSILILAVVFAIVASVKKQLKVTYNRFELPSKTHPILVWKLINSPTSKQNNYGGTVMGLIWKGAILIDGKTKSKFSKDYEWHFNQDYSPANPIEEAFLEELSLLDTKKHKPIIEMVKKISQNSKNPLGKILQECFFDDKFGDELRTKQFTKRVAVSLFAMILSIVLIIPAAILWENGIGYAFIPMIILTVISLIALIYYGSQETLTLLGKEERAIWIGFKKFFKESLKQKDIPMDEDYLKEVFPYLVIFGLDKPFLKLLTKNNVEVPEFLAKMNFEDWHSFSTFNGTFVAVFASSGAGGGGAGGGGGAAGGGGAGAS